MGIITRMRIHKAVYWALLSYDGAGRPVLAQPVEVNCRWDDKQELAVDSHGEGYMSKATVYPDREFTLNGFMWKGSLSAQTPADPSKETQAIEIRSVEKISKLRGGSEILYIATG